MYSSQTVSRHFIIVPSSSPRCERYTFPTTHTPTRPHTHTPTCEVDRAGHADLEATGEELEQRRLPVYLGVLDLEVPLAFLVLLGVLP